MTAGIYARTVERRRDGHALLRTSDLELLSWIAEQYGARTDQLAVLMGCGQRTVQRTLARLRSHGLIETRRLLDDEAPWVTLTARGLRACCSTFGVWQPRIGLIAHTGAVNDVRLHIQQRDPAAEWVPERQLARQRTDSRQHLPDGIVLTGGQRVAIEVELTPKSRKRLEGILDQLAAAHDQTVYFCAPAPHRLLSELAGTGRWPSVGVRTLPGSEDATG